jgi:hypothetical protein
MVATRVEVALAKADLAIEALSGPISADAAEHGWTDESRRDALQVLMNWRSNLEADGEVHPENEMGWWRWIADQGLSGVKTTDPPDAWVRLIQDLDLYVERMHRWWRP